MRSDVALLVMQTLNDPSTYRQIYNVVDPTVVDERIGLEEINRQMSEQQKPED